MYLAYYGLNQEAFHTTPDPNFLFLSTSHKEALGAIVYGVEKRKGFIEIVGEVGVGKTTIIRTFLEAHCDPKYKVIYIFNPAVSYHGLLTVIFRELDLLPIHDDVPEMVQQLQEALIEVYKEHGTVVLIIDEAQNMPIETLESLRMLSNLETSTDKLMQVVLVGQPEMETLLHRPELRQFQQRIALRAKICPLTEKESQALILHRIAVASTPGNPVFTTKALRLIARKGGGIPRRLNILCDNALITGFGRQITPVPVSVVKEILSDVDGAHSPVAWKWAALVAGFVLLLGLSLMVLRGPLSSYINSERLQAVNLDKNDDLTKDGRSTTDSLTGGSMSRSNIIQNSTSNNSSMQSATRSNNVGSDHVLENSSEVVKSQSEKDTDKTLSRISIDPLTSPSSSSQSQADSALVRSVVTSRGVQAGKGLTSKEKSIDAQSAQASTNIKDDSIHHNSAVRFESDTTEVTSSPASGRRQTRAVQDGESLSRIANEAYGSTDIKYIDWVKRHNPQIVDPDMILPGQKLWLPEYRKDDNS